MSRRGIMATTIADSSLGKQPEEEAATAHSMTEVIRLTGVAAVLQLIVDGVMFATPQLVGFSDHVFPLDSLLALTPTVAVLTLSLLGDRYHWRSSRFVGSLLVGLIIAFTSESIGTAVAAQPFFNPNRFFVPIQTPLLFLFIPVVLGGWMSGRRGTFVWSGLGILALLVSTLASATFTPTPAPLPLTPILVQAAVMIVIAYFVGALADRQRAEHIALRAAHQALAAQAGMRVQLAASGERLRLARNLHDTLAHTMAGLLVQLRAIDTLLLTNTTKAHTELAIAQQAAQQGLLDLRSAIGELRAGQVQDLGLVGALQQLLERLSQRTRIKTTLAQTGGEPQLGDQDAEMLFLIAQESIRNAERHANPTEVSVILHQHPRPNPSFTMTIRDNGRGFQPATIPLSNYGIRGIYERAELNGAQVRIQSAPGSGTTVVVTLLTHGPHTTPPTPMAEVAEVQHV